jgi:hypothetical protein
MRFARVRSVFLAGLNADCINAGESIKKYSFLALHISWVAELKG